MAGKKPSLKFECAKYQNRIKQKIFISFNNYQDNIDVTIFCCDIHIMKSACSLLPLT